MKKSLLFTMVVAVVISLGACSNANKTKTVEKNVEKEVIHEGHDHDGHNHEGHDHDAMHEHDSDGETAMLCGDCGQIKGSDKCCAEDAVKCDKCDLDKGSPGCCKITADTKLCSHCGEIANSEDCCKKDAKVCDKCGLHASSPGCCTI